MVERMPARRNTRRKAILGLLLVGLLLEAMLAVVVFASDGGDRGGQRPSTALPLHPVAGTFKPDDTKVEDCVEGSPKTCAEQAFGNIAFYEGPKVALARFDEAYGAGENPDCHRVAHAIGSASLARNKGDVARTFAQGSSSCFSGYYHGVLERSLVGVTKRDPETLGRVARRLCRNIKLERTLWLAYQCLHGLGHGLMITTGYTLPLSLEACDRLDTSWQRTSCNGGAFMENISTSYGVASRWLRDGDPVYPCNWVAEEDKIKCYEIVTSRILRTVGGSWAKTSEICAAAEKNWVTACFRSLGRDSAGQAHQDPVKIRELCAEARPYGGEATCITGAAMAMTGNFKSGKQSSAFCSGSPTEFREGCFYGIGAVMVLYGNTAAKREANCTSITSVARYAAACVRAGDDYLALVNSRT
jgi:hypothetical protein